MGQEIGHAYEDVLEHALQTILPRISVKNKIYRVAKGRSLEGISANIDHIIEIKIRDEPWRPHILFMEKFSDSSNESEKAFRRHLEEYIQVKILRSEGKSAPDLIVNLIYGEKNGWKESILRQAKKLLHHTIFLPDRNYYHALQDKVKAVIKTHAPNYNRHKIRPDLIKKIKSEQCFEHFCNEINDLLINIPVASAAQQSWENNIIAKNKESTALNLGDACYIRKGLTELLVLPKPTREWTVGEIIKNNTSIYVKKTSSEHVKKLQLCSAGLELRKSIGGDRMAFSSYLTCGTHGSNILKICDTLEYILMSSTNPYKMESSDYLAYFDISDEYYISTTKLVLEGIISLLKGNPNTLINQLMDVCANSSLSTNRSQNRVQNLVLETILAHCSVLNRIAFNKRIDLSLAKLSKTTRISESRLNSIRSGSVIKPGESTQIVSAIKSFILEHCSILNAIRILETELISFNTWVADPRSPIPSLINPKTVMSISWMRHNQLNSHPIFNPLGSLHWLSTRKTLAASYKSYGFPERRSANPVQIVVGSSTEDSAYEFSCVFWCKKSNSLFINETCSVINLKHTSDKCKELSARMRIVKSILEEKCKIISTIVVDGDWTISHMNDLQRSGWDNVIYSRDFLLKHIDLFDL
jgi:hypothetical protein